MAATVLFWLLVCAAGVVSLRGLKIELFPDIAFPVVVVEARAPILAARAMVDAVTAPIEHQLLQIEGQSSVRSSTYPGFSAMQVAFGFGQDVSASKDETSLAVRRALTPPIVLTSVSAINLNESAVSTYALTSGRSGLEELTRIASARIKPQLESVDGVLRVDVDGGVDAAGRRSQFVSYNGRDAVSLDVIKTASGNTLEISDQLEDRMRDLRSSLAGITIDRAATQAPYIREASTATTEALAIAVALSILVIYPFLRSIRATLIAALAIPTSLLGTFIVMRLLHFNLETITLLALALVVGVIIDDAIVTIENIVRHAENGESPREAAYAANKEIGRALMAATFTIVAVFLPIGLMTGTLGQFFKPFGITASAAILISLLVARTLTPALASVLLRPGPPADDRGRNENEWYRRSLAWALSHRRAIVGGAIAIFFAGLAIVPFIPKGFLPHLDRGAFRVAYTMAPTTTLAAASAASDALEQALRRDPAVASVFSSFGVRQPGQGVMDVNLHAARDASTFAVENRVRGKLPQIPGVTVAVEDVPFVENGTAKPVEFSLLGDDLAKVRTAGSAFERWMRGAPSIFAGVASTGIAKDHGVERIERVNGQNAVSLSSDLAPGATIGDVTSRIDAEAKRTLPPGVRVFLGGMSADAVRTFGAFGILLALSVVAIFGVLQALFRNWVDPIAIVAALPLSIVGAFFALWVTGADFGMISLMGTIFLFGLVNKNAILLVDAIKRLRAGGLSRGEAILEAGSQRLRPIVMTTVATILGMLPIALGFGAGAELRAPMAVAIIGGLITSTIFSLLVVPVVYTLVDDVKPRPRLSLVPAAKAAS